MKRFLSALALTLFLTVPALASYSDVPEIHPYIKGITYIELQGASDHSETFRPDDIITRAESYKLLFEVLQMEPGASVEPPFEDTPADAWFTPYAGLALENDLLSERQAYFYPDKQVRRMDALRLMMKTYGLTTPVIHGETGPLFKDVEFGSATYPWLYQLVQLDILTAQPEESFSAYAPITRGEFAEWLYQFDAWMQIFELDQYAQSHPDFYKAEIFADIWELILNNHYLETNEHIDEDALFQAAVKGMVASLNDPYSNYFTPEEASGFTESISGEFEGIGAILNQNEAGEIVITGVLQGGPAEAAGLMKNDIIKFVDGVDVTGMTMDAVVSRIKGPEGTYVTLSLLRGDMTLLIELERAHIEIVLQSGSIKWGDTWVLDIDSFSSDLPGALMQEIFELQASTPDPEAIVLDLRGNPGGSLRSATFVSGLFLPQLTPLVQLNYGSFTELIYNGDVGPYKEYPIYILIDENSASASEIVALTLQDHGATVIGHQSFGKGTAQNYTTYWDGSAVKLTIAEWLSGAGRSIQGVGVTPDLVLPDYADEEDWWEAVKQRL